jgi:hypothetical protein
MPTFDNNLGINETWNINIDINSIANALVANPAFIKAVAEAIRISQTKQVRSMGNLYGHTAQREKPTPATKRRLR